TSFAMRNKVQSLDRALEILRLLGSEPEMRVTDLARRLEVHKSTVFRLLSTLQEHGLVDQNPTTERYRLGYGLVRPAGPVLAAPPAEPAATPTHAANHHRPAHPREAAASGPHGWLRVYARGARAWLECRGRPRPRGGRPGAGRGQRGRSLLSGHPTAPD